MCYPLIFMAAAAGISAIAAVKQGEDRKQEAEAQAQQKNIESAYAADDSRARAEKIRRLGKTQQGEANAALAASGVQLGEGTALEVRKTIATRSEEDALSAILGGTRASRTLDTEAGLLRDAGRNAQSSGYLNATSSALGSYGSYSKGGWVTSAKGG